MTATNRGCEGRGVGCVFLGLSHLWGGSGVGVLERQVGASLPLPRGSHGTKECKMQLEGEAAQETDHRHMGQRGELELSVASDRISAPTSSGT